MEKWIGRVAMVTGASDGIGAEVSRTLVKYGMMVIGCARNIERMQKMSEELSGEKGKFIGYKCDLRKEEEILGMFEFIKEKHGGVDVCINNAGVSFGESSLLKGKTEYWRAMMEVNMLGLCICTREAYASMKERGVKDGQIIHINSTLGHKMVNMPDVHVYQATKHAVRTLLYGLRSEIRADKTQVRVAEISPGIADTSFYDNMFAVHGAAGAEMAESVKKAFPTSDSKDEFVQRHLTELGCAELIPTFQDQMMDEEAFRNLTQEMLKELIPILGQRSKVFL